MASAASGQGRILTKADAKGMSGKELRRLVDEGYALSPGLVKSLNNRPGDYESRAEMVVRHAGGDAWSKKGLYTGSLAGVKGAQLPPGMAYYGSTTVTEPAKGSRSVNGGWTSSKERTTHIPIVMPRDMVAGQQQEPTRAPQEAKQPLEPDQGLLNARQRYREALDRAKTYTEQGGSAASYAYDSPLSKSGPELYAGIDKQAREEIAQYTKRFPDFWDAKANLTAQEIGFASREAINQLSADLNLPDYTSIFPDSGAAGDKIAEKGLYGWLSNQKRLG